MRMMLRWTVPAEAGNAAIKKGTLQKSIDKMIKQLKPEAAYFMAQDGRRSGLFFFDMADTSQIPVIAEPLFQTFNADVEFVPVMNADDLKKAFSKLGG